MKNAFLYLLFFTSKHIMDTCVCVHNNFVPLHVQNFYSPPTVNLFQLFNKKNIAKIVQPIVLFYEKYNFLYFLVHYHFYVNMILQIVL